MNKFFTTALLLIAALSASPLFAAVLRVNNTPGVNAPYATFAAAQTAAASGDVIQLEPSNTSYGILTVTKNVTIMGAGYLLGTGQNTGLQYTALEASCDAVNFNTGSAGARITGMRILGNVTVSVSTITVERNILYTQTYSTGYDVNITGGATPGTSDVFVRDNWVYSINGTGTEQQFQHCQQHHQRGHYPAQHNVGLADAQPAMLRWRLQLGRHHLHRLQFAGDEQYHVQGIGHQRNEQPNLLQ